MSKSLKSFLAAAVLVGSAFAAHADGNPIAGEKVFAKCKACHSVGEGAKNRSGPVLNGVFGRIAGTLGNFRYSKAMIAAGAAGLTWSEETLAAYLVDPKGLVRGNSMAFGGLRNSSEVDNVVAYLKTFADTAAEPDKVAAAQAKAAPVIDSAGHALSEGPMKLGRVATAEEVAAWDIDIRPDGAGLPPGRGTVTQGEELFVDNCAVCHGDFGEAVGRWPVLAGGQDTLTKERPEKTIGSYWPYLSTVFDYVRRAMPFGNARSLSDDDIYAITAYLLYLNDVVTDEDFELSDENFSSVRLPNEANFIEDDRASEPFYAAGKVPCMKDCKPAVEITKRAAVIDVTPDDETDGAGSID